MSVSEIIRAIEKAGAASNWRAMFSRAGAGRIFRLGSKSVPVSTLDYVNIMKHFEGVVTIDPATARARRAADAATARNK